MGDRTLIHTLPFSRAGELSTLVENRRAFTLDSLELNIYETYRVSQHVPLCFDDLVMINMIQGKKIMHLENVKAFDYLPGQMMVLPASVAMHIDFPEATLDQPTQCTALTIHKEKIAAVLDYLNEFYPKEHVNQWGLDPDFFHLYNSTELADLVNKLFQIIISENPLKDVLADLTFKELTIRLLQSQSLIALKIGKSPNKVLLHVQEFIQKHITEKISIGLLERTAHMSKASLTRMFNRELGLSPMEYVIQQRIEKAKKMLLLTRNVKESCYGAGFNDVNYFVRLFKSRVGMTPGAFVLAR
ncbi:AraC family transcriptional regulator [Sphingobacterium paramultivorum]|uniref:AraC family transcriptional regulator n=1 Tax=Sphingobacterium paramultivorum TaxID=2886510 RepID=A0A7G5E946_9SPHI|nr:MULTISPECIES: AraC family transcriptional regulator [Sphingobacterium]QMV70521.1 AraC family transcriptional regulator [Sphingobacterium paramultivorum]WET71573.1 MAG: AraC family transcriptional regulator [Sphingobacterium sp.]WSO14383.1 AraC family transcriptional regulator [Sphingobacterium paramultivorum]